MRTTPQAPQVHRQDADLQAMKDNLENLERLADLLAEDSEDASKTPVQFTTPADFLLSVVVPVYNEADTIQTVLARIDSLPIRKEIIAVDDCSSDNSREILKRFEARRQLASHLQDEE